MSESNKANNANRKDPSKVIKQVEARKAKRQKKQKQTTQLIIAAAAVVVLAVIIIVIVTSCGKKNEDNLLNSLDPKEPIAADQLTEGQATGAPDTEATIAPTPAPTPKPVQYLEVYKKGPEDQKKIAITINIPKNADNLVQIMTIAASNGAKLTLFPLGSVLDTDTDMQAAVRTAVWTYDFEVENCTYSLKELYKATDREMAEEIWKQKKAVDNAIGLDYEQHFLRTENSSTAHDPRTHQYLIQLGTFKGLLYSTYDASGRSLDNAKANLDKNGNGKIFTFTTSDDDVKLLTEFIPYAVQQGFAMVTANELLGFEENARNTNSEDSTMPIPMPFVYDTYVVLGGDTGSKVYPVQLLQQRLIELGYLPAGSSVDGNYGKNTKSAVEAFQQVAGLKVDGIAGVQTQTLLFSDEAPFNPGSDAALFSQSESSGN
ncbi:MAG: peptidoglycan-binding protein [Clostridia bacterium]|nr:peptidoglycan-binding protein [Clostridia bacterium]